MWPSLLLLVIIILALGKRFLGTESKAYLVLFIPCAVVSIVAVAGMAWDVTH